MSEFIANVRAKLDTSELDQLNKLKEKTVDVKVNLTGDGADFAKTFSKQMSSLATSATNAGKNVGNSFNTALQNSIKSSTNQVGKGFVKNIESSISQSKFTTAQNKLSSLQSIDLSKYSNTTAYNQFNANLEKAVQLQSRLNSEMAKGNDANIDQINADLKEMNSLLTKSSTLYSNLSKPISSLDATAASNKTLTWLKNNSKAAKDYGEILEDLADKQKKATTQGELDNLNKQVKSIQTEAASLGKTGASFKNEFARAFNQIFQFSQIYGGIDKVIDSVATAVTKLKEMDDILTEISKVSDLSATQLEKLGKEAFTYASNYGKTVTDYLEGVTEMNRSGYYGQQGIDLANTSVLAQAAGDMDADVANAYLLATNAAYEYAGSAEKLNAVLDGQNMITNRNSVDMTDMAEATTQAGAMAAQAGVEIDQLSALIGTAVARTKKSGNEIGTSLKSLFVNLQNTQSSKIVSTFESLGISMTEMVGDSELLKTPIELLKELSEVYNALPDGSTAKADILTNIGGKYHANVLSSILAGYSDYEQMLVDYSEGTGSATREAEKSANNWTGSLNKLSNSYTKFIGNFVQSDQVITGINLVNEFVNSFDDLVNTLTPLGTVAAGGGLFASFKNVGRIKCYSSYRICLQ